MFSHILADNCFFQDDTFGQGSGNTSASENSMSLFLDTSFSLDAKESDPDHPSSIAHPKKTRSVFRLAAAATQGELLDMPAWQMHPVHVVGG